MAERTERTLFDLPTDPEDFGVLLTPADLVKIDYSALEFETARRALIEYIKTYYPNDFNDFVSNNGIMMLVEALSYLVANISLRGDILANESFVPTAQTVEAMVNHLALIGQKMRGATPAVVDMQCIIDTAISADVNVPSGIKITTSGGDGSTLTYEVYRAPDDFISPITIPAGKRGIIAYGIEGETVSDEVISEGEADQQIVIYGDNILASPITVTTTSTGAGNNTVVEEWIQIDIIQKADANDKVYEVRLFDDRMVLVFGDGINGEMPENGQIISATYRIGGGVKGRVGAGVLATTTTVIPEPPFNVPVLVTLTNPAPSVGGADAETVEGAKRRAPREFATHNSAVTRDDYSQLSAGFAHPVFGTVSKALATIRTGINTNSVEIYILAEGSNSTPTTPTAGLKEGLAVFLDENNPITDEVVVLDGSIKYVSIRMNVIMDRDADAPTVKLKVDTAIDDFFSIDNWDMGEPFYQSQFINTINSIDGVEYVDLFEPADNILPTNALASSTVDGVGINELIHVGDKNVTYYFNS
jgi:phage-related baseplate assembly protein